MSKKTTLSKAGKKRIARGNARKDKAASPTLQSGETTSTASDPAGPKDAVPAQPAVSFPVVGIGASAGGLRSVQRASSRRCRPTPEWLLC